MDTKPPDKNGHCGFCYNGPPSNDSERCEDPQLTGNFTTDISLIMKVNDIELLTEFLRRCWYGGEHGGPLLSYEEEAILKSHFGQDVYNKIVTKLSPLAKKDELFTTTCPYCNTLNGRANDRCYHCKMNL